MTTPIVVVTQVQLCLTSSRLAPTRPFFPDSRTIFSSVTFTCVRLPTMDKVGIVGAKAARRGLAKAPERGCMAWPEGGQS